MCCSYISQAGCDVRAAIEKVWAAKFAVPCAAAAKGVAGRTFIPPGFLLTFKDHHVFGPCCAAQFEDDRRWERVMKHRKGRLRLG